MRQNFFPHIVGLTKLRKAGEATSAGTWENYDMLQSGMFATLRLLLVYLTLGPLAGLLGIPYTLIVQDIALLYRVAMWIADAGVRAAGIRIEVTGLEHVPPGRACIFMSNHVSNLDPPVELPMLPGRASVMLKKELMSIPILGRAMRMGDFISVERGGRRDAAQESVVAAGKALAKGLHILVYPEGTRSRDGRLQAFKKGPFYLAMETGAPIVPIAISGTEGMMRKGSWAITPGVARVRMLPVIEPSQFATREELLRAVRQEIAEALPEEMRPLE
jgi:1-acyl-sn-glycerol-3-phosphate acyltransferase